MCLMVLNWRPKAAVPLLVVANRDEFRNRPTEPMHWWPADGTRPALLAGRDQQAGGTWLAIGEQGDFALLTNIRPGYIGRSAERSRGELPLRFIETLATGGTLNDFHRDIQAEISSYGGFNLIVSNRQRLLWFSSDHPEGQNLAPGIHALSNDALNTPWPKTQAAIAQMQAQTELLESDFNAAEVLTDRQPAEIEDLPFTGVPADIERQLSAQTICGEHYGTRCRTWMRVTADDHIDVQENQLDMDGDILSQQPFSWQLSAQ